MVLQNYAGQAPAKQVRNLFVIRPSRNFFDFDLYLIVGEIGFEFTIVTWRLLTLHLVEKLLMWGRF